ncbi:MAG: response regulator [Proteobacteria bacterium]|nr:response regulator [Pseudomonadota bacterium]
MKKKVMLIDDDINHLITTKEILEDEGFEVNIHQSPFGSTNAIREYKPHLILLDINMPGLSGDKLAKLLKENELIRNIPIIFYSSNDEDSLRKAVKDYSAQDYICKGDIFKLRRKIIDFFKENKF